MPEIIPFRAIHYPWGSDFSRLLAPPYDVISPEERQALHRSHENNVIAVTLGGDHSGDDEGKYEAAGSRLREWISSGVLLVDPQPMFFLYGMTFSDGDDSRTTLGLVASLALEEFGSGQIFPHERTIPGPVQDRLRLMRATEANLEPLWFFASSRIDGFRSVMERTMSEAPLARATDAAGVDHCLWGLSPADAAHIVEAISGTPLVIADGHHRYETALAYQQERRREAGEGPWDQTLALIVDPIDYPPLLKPIHRLAYGMSVGQIAEFVADAQENTDAGENSSAASVPLEKVNAGLGDVVKLVEEEGPGTIGVVTARGSWITRTRAELDTVFLNDTILEPSGAAVRYEHDPEQIAAALEDGAVAFILAAAPIELVAAKALSGERMPPKTTLFWPKPRTGFVLRDLSQP